jgi:hypothetical protein
MSHPMLAPLLGFAARLRFPTLFLITVGLFALDLIIPDFIPFADEILLGLGSLLLANWKNSKLPEPPIPPERPNP